MAHQLTTRHFWSFALLLLSHPYHLFFFFWNLNNSISKRNLAAGLQEDFFKVNKCYDLHTNISPEVC